MFINLYQVIGSAFAIYRISPEMTGMMLIVVPSVIAVGTFFGSFLRAVSKMAQAQVRRTNI
jgi:ATP-binding cassette subfamily B (MDR/TAP) protein 8